MLYTYFMKKESISLNNIKNFLYSKILMQAVFGGLLSGLIVILFKNLFGYQFKLVLSITPFSNSFLFELYKSFTFLRICF